MSRPTTTDHQPAVDPGFRKPVKMAVITSPVAGVSQCSCGSVFRHTRTKARENAVQRHLDKRHKGRGLWL